jgi:hypothetical protein
MKSIESINLTGVRKVKGIGIEEIEKTSSLKYVYLTKGTKLQNRPKNFTIRAQGSDPIYEVEKEEEVIIKNFIQNGNDKLNRFKNEILADVNINEARIYLFFETLFEILGFDEEKLIRRVNEKYNTLKKYLCNYYFY